VAGVTEVDRQRVVDELERRAAAGELSPEELADRTRRARTVSTLAGLDGIVLDHPGASTDLPVHASHPSHSSHSGAATGWVPPGSASTDSGSGSPPAPVAQGPAPVARPPQWGSWLVVALAVGVIAVLLLGALVGLRAGGSGSGAETEVVDPRPEPASTVPSPATTEPPATTTTALDGAPPTGPAPSGDAVELQVGVDIQPGVYTTAGVQPSACSWQRTVPNPGVGHPWTVVAEDTSVRPLIEVVATDDRLRLRGCSPLVPYLPPPTPATSVGDGDWLVGQDIAPGRYRVTVDDVDAEPYCRWSRARGLGYGAADVIETDSIYRSDPAEVDLAEGERFSLSGCGTWTLG
jgi:hypothetical protein